MVAGRVVVRDGRYALADRDEIERAAYEHGQALGAGTGRAHAQGRGDGSLPGLARGRRALSRAPLAQLIGGGASGA